ncbi:dihydrolipoamide acetyltransferase family protein [Pseudonocardia cypriaca]|uniref:Dihydrolipoamide acetyltransferase component of pyruvate dehydrogenase complex n=1 Tax=Pseudonocardia cypriaca TaxID=882449 RepID=A0A543FQ95_9PSEU|nr:dihydrolipoamide acetyltransferase family protein [Pseudonocardia cypriaca]TQM35904.1 pyruvate dehydrogenase E2 component (dihydrolipoamide acetyltransferase) [Pseudonocardia cypriaca]
MLREFTLPDVGEGLTEAEIVTWQVEPGDTVTVNQVICEIETAKAAVELPSPWAGTVAELLARPGETIEVGTPIIAIDTGGGAPVAKADDEEAVPNLVGYGPRQGSVTRRARRGQASPAAAPEPAPEPAPEAPRDGAAPLAKPPVRKLAKDLGVDLRSVSGSGEGGVITRADVEAAVAPAPSAPAPAPSAPAPAPSAPAPSVGGVRREPIRGVRKATAAAVSGSAFTAPHVTEFLAVDVTETMALRDRLRATREYADVKLTPLAFVAKAVCLAAKRTPDVNASWDEAAGEIVYYDRVQLGIAAATPRGLIVPKIRNADTLSLRELAGALADLTGTARAGKTPPANLVGGTFTITNVGVFGVDTGTPIINPGEAAILAVGAIKPMPWVVDGELAVRTVCQLALSFDHRLVDGEQGSRFLADVGALLADPGLALTW